MEGLEPPTRSLQMNRSKPTELHRLVPSHLRLPNVRIFQKNVKKKVSRTRKKNISFRKCLEIARNTTALSTLRAGIRKSLRVKDKMGIPAMDLAPFGRAFVRH